MNAEGMGNAGFRSTGLGFPEARLAGGINCATCWSQSREVEVEIMVLSSHVTAVLEDLGIAQGHGRSEGY